MTKTRATDEEEKKVAPITKEDVKATKDPARPPRVPTRYNAF